ncbi:unnamed protein product [Amoebophrya sp. A25]|nr:unnamed protein product [Amoebophrya sp. A25]|eukprot:GSA25T00022393001.1
MSMGALSEALAISQLDAEVLDREVIRVLFEAVRGLFPWDPQRQGSFGFPSSLTERGRVEGSSALGYFGVDDLLNEQSTLAVRPWLEERGPHLIGLCVPRLILWYATVWRDASTPGMQLQNIALANGHAIDAHRQWRKVYIQNLTRNKENFDRERDCNDQVLRSATSHASLSSDTSTSLSKTQKILLLVADLTPWRRITDALADFLWKLKKRSPDEDTTESRVFRSKVRDVAAIARSAFTAAFLAGLIRYASVTHFFANIRFVPLQPGARRLIAQDYMRLLPLLFSHVMRSVVQMRSL